MTENRYIETKVTDTGIEPVTLAQAKLYMNITSTDYDALITELITVARQRVEQFTHLSLIEKDVILTVDVCSPVILPYPVNTITTVEYLAGQNTDGTNDWTELVYTDEEYQVIGEDNLELHSSVSGIHRITYTTTARTEAGLLLAVKMVTNWLFRNRLDEPAAMPESIFEHAKPYKNYTWG